MASAPAILFKYDGSGIFVAANKYALAAAEKYYVAGEEYSLLTKNIRSSASHSHQFAAIHEAWANFPDEMREMFPTAEALRHYALIKSGWCNTQTFAMASVEDAKKLQAQLKSHDEYAIIVRHDDVVTQFTAKSQSYKAMTKEEFQKSKDDCLSIVAQLLHVNKNDLAKHAGTSSGGER